MDEWGILSPYRVLADRCKLSEKTLRYALSGGAISLTTAGKIAKALGLKAENFRLRTDARPPAHSAMQLLAKRSGFCLVVLKGALERKRAITLPTALKISKALETPIECYKIKQDNRGRPKK